MTEGAGGLDGAIDSAFEPERALEHVEGDSDLLASAARSFLRENAIRMDEMREAVHQGDAERVQHLAHGLCGAACNFVAAHAEHCTRALEEAAAQRDTAAWASLLEALKAAATRSSMSMDCARSTRTTATEWATPSCALPACASRRVSATSNRC